MRFRNSLRLLMENFKLVYKLLCSRIVIALVAMALTSTFVLPELDNIIGSAEIQNLLSEAKELLSAFLIADGEKMGIVKDAIFDKGGVLSQATSFLSSRALEISFTIVGCVLVYLLKRYAETVCYFTTGSMLNDKMASYADSGYWSTFVANLGKASVYSVVYVPLVFLFDVCILAVIWLVMSFMPIWAGLFLSMTATVFLQAFKLSITSHWMPAMVVDGKGIGKAMYIGENRVRKQRLKTFSVYLVTVYFIVAINVMVGICTFGSGLLITVPASYFFLICMQYVNYYTIKGKKYFLTFEHIATNPDFGDSEHFFEYIEKANEENKDNKE